MLLHLNQGTVADAQGALGQYHSSLIIPQLFLSLSTVVAGIVLPYLSAYWERNEQLEAKAVLQWTLKAVGVLFLLGNVAVLAVAPALFRWVLEGRYDAGMSIMPLTMVYCYWLSLITVAQLALWCTERVRMVAIATCIGLLANIAFNASLIPMWGLTGAVVATTAANAVCLATLLLCNQRAGWQVDRGLVLVCVAPLILVLGTVPAILCALLLAYAIVRYEWVFTAAEKEQLDQVVQAARSRLLRRAGLGMASPPS
jgi:O-antigen/teichoic acid export membrane protein